MAPKRGNVRDATPSAPAAAAIAGAGPTTTPSLKSQKASANQTYDKVVTNIANHYMDTTPQRTKLIDSFMAFLVVVGALQFLYCVLAGNYVSLGTPAEDGDAQRLTCLTALQCLPVWLLRDRWAIRVDR